MTERPVVGRRAPWQLLRSSLVVGVASVALSCGGAADKCVDKSKPELDSCTAKAQQLQGQINTLKRQLAQALANPGTINVDPSVLEIDGSPIKTLVKEGTISQAQVIAVLTANKKSLQPCYNRALKRDSSLHHQAIKLALSMKIQPSGSPSNIALGPAYNTTMIECMKRAMQRWRFPAFKGTPVGVESPLTFKPRR